LSRALVWSGKILSKFPRYTSRRSPAVSPLVYPIAWYGRECRLQLIQTPRPSKPIPSIFTAKVSMDSGLGLLYIPAGFFFIVGFVMVLFLFI
jgi:hypothetical protein